MFNKIDPQSWKEGIALFKEKTEAFHAGEIDRNGYKGTSGKFGSYAQKDPAVHMLRLRMTAGRLTKDKMNYIAESLKKHNVNMLHYTTCQTVQLHNLHPEALYDIMEGGLDHNIVTMGGGGDFPRNVMCAPLSGVQKDEFFHVMPYAEALAEYMMNYINTPKMPRKLKIGFSNSPANIPHSTYRDLGFIARSDGKFDIWSAGGLGNGPSFGVKVADAVEPNKILYYARAMWKTFCAYGNYENRGKARSRFIVEALGGAENYVKAFNEKLEEVYAEGENLDLDIVIEEITKKGDGTTAAGPRVIEQKQDGLYAVLWHPLGGTPTPEEFIAVNELIKDMEAVELRIDPNEQVYIINLTGAEAEKVLAVTANGAQNIFECSVSCVGATICQQGVRDSAGLLKKCIEATRAAELPCGALPIIHISGCPSSCGTHQTAALGFRGGVKLIDKVAHPAFTFSVNGCSLQGKEAMGREIGTMLETEIPAFLVELGKAVTASGMKYDEWNAANPDAIEKIAAPYLK